MDYEDINDHMTEPQKTSLRAATLQQMAGTTMTYDEINNCLSEQQKTSLMTAALQTMVADASGAPQEYTNYDDVNNQLSEQQKSSLMAAALMYLKDNGGGGGLGIPLSVSQTGALTRSNDSFTFTTPPEVTQITFDASNRLYGLPYAFYNCKGLTNLDLSSVTSITGSDVLRACFSSCSNLVSVDFSGLETINGSDALNSAFQYCGALASVDFSSLRRITSYNAMYHAFESCRSLTSLSFPSFDASVSGGDALKNMLTGVTGCTVHFPASQESIMSSWSSVTNGFGGTNTTVLFDL